MSTAQDFDAATVSAVDVIPVRRSAWEAWELLIGYSLILSVIWTPRPVNLWLYWGAVGWFVFSIVSSFPGWRALGFRVAGFWRSLWVVGVAMSVAAIAVYLAARMHTLHEPSGLTEWLNAFLGYTIWSFVQQCLMQGYFLLRLVRVLPSQKWAAISAASIFAVAHLPNPILTPLTLLWGFTACLVFLRFRNIYPLAIAHAIFGICVAITLPAPVVHNMRVGLGYLRYRAPQHLHLSQSDHRVSTVACVMVEAPTRR